MTEHLTFDIDTLNASVDNLVASPENVELIPNDTDNESLEMDSSNDNRHSFIRGRPNNQSNRVERRARRIHQCLNGSDLS